MSYKYVVTTFLGMLLIFWAELFAAIYGILTFFALLYGIHLFYTLFKLKIQAAIGALLNPPALILFNVFSIAGWGYAAIEYHKVYLVILLLHITMSIYLWTAWRSGNNLKIH